MHKNNKPHCPRCNNKRNDVAESLHHPCLELRLRCKPPMESFWPCLKPCNRVTDVLKSEVKKLGNCNLTANGDNACQHSVQHKIDGTLLGTKDDPSVQVSQLNEEPSKHLISSVTLSARKHLPTKSPCSTECTSPPTGFVAEEAMSRKNGVEGNHSAPPKLVCEDKGSSAFTHHMSL